MLEKTLSARYYIVKHLGGGGFGQTYIAEDRQLPDNPLCVVKQLKPKNTDPFTLEIARRLFDREARVLYKLGNHDRIPRLLAHFEEDEEFYLVQEFIDGDELKLELSAKKQLSQIQVVGILQEILKILEFVHQQDVIHRDIKPSNLIRRKQDGKIVLIDFGAVKQISIETASSNGQTNLTVAIGSPGYMPSEQLGGKPRFCSDIYAVGMVGIEALTGLLPSQLPEDPATSEIVWRDRTTVSPDFANVLDRMVCYDYRQRYQTVTEALQALESVNADLSTQTFNALRSSPASATVPFQSFSLPQQTTHDSPTNALTPQTEMPPQVIDSSLAEVLPSQRDGRCNTGVSRLMKIGVGVATVIAMTAGIYLFQKPKPLWQGAQNISLANNLTGHLDRVHGVAISPDGQTIASASFDKTVKVWNLQNGASDSTLKGHSDWVYGVAFSPDGQTLVSSSGDGTIKLWNFRTGEVTRTLSESSDARSKLSKLPVVKLKDTRSGSSNRVYSIAISPDGQTLASANQDMTIKLWNLSTGQLKNTLIGHSNLVWAIAISPDGQTLASSSDDRTIKLWNLFTGELKSTFSDPSSDKASSIAFTKDGETLVSSSFNKINVWNVRNLLTGCTGAQPCLPSRTLSGHLDNIQTVAISPDGETIASGGRDKTIKLWNLPTGELKTTISNRGGYVDSLTFSRDGKILVGASDNKNTIEIWRSQ